MLVEPISLMMSSRHYAVALINSTLSLNFSKREKPLLKSLSVDYCSVMMLMIGHIYDTPTRI
jgi:hypothetical protein